jgi:pyridoxine/pyridoxamine 5'-phosphate oxidase
METGEFVAFVQQHGLAVVATLGPNDTPQAAVVAVVATDLGEVVFGCDRDSRKFANIQRRREVALAIGWDDDEIAVQCEGTADEPRGTARERCERCYLERFPREQQLVDDQEIGLVRVRPGWLRYADTRADSFRWEETFPATADG